MEQGHHPDGKGARTTWALANDLSCVLPTHDGFGIYTTELEAQTELVDRLTGEFEHAEELLRDAEARLKELTGYVRPRERPDLQFVQAHVLVDGHGLYDVFRTEREAAFRAYCVLKHRRLRDGPRAYRINVYQRVAE